jgi:hypothetical protein
MTKRSLPYFFATATLLFTMNLKAAGNFQYPQLTCQLPEGVFTAPIGLNNHLLTGASLGGQAIVVGNTVLPMYVGSAGAVVRTGSTTSYLPNSVMWEFGIPSSENQTITLDVPANFLDKQGQSGFKAMSVSFDSSTGLISVNNVICEVH